ncbi:MAG: phosphotransferase, partial [Micrococcaceae bacterium]|nr:phosphotransferase [Micrococcaceae bacterium]
LPFLAPRLPFDVPVPVPLHRGKPGSGYPYHWAIVPWLPGLSAARVPALIRDGYAGELAAFMQAMHVPAPAEVPRKPVRGVSLRERNRTMRTRLETLEPAERAALTAMWERGLSEAEYDGPRLWLHGDPHPHNLLMKGSADTTTAELSAVIDFGNLTAGDPASDVGFAWLHFTESGRKVFFEQLCGHRLYPPGTWNRARAWAVGHAVLMARLPPVDPLHAAGVHGIGQLLA